MNVKAKLPKALMLDLHRASGLWVFIGVLIRVPDLSRVELLFRAGRSRRERDVAEPCRRLGSQACTRDAGPRPR